MKTTMNVRRIMRDSLLTYFAPIRGAVRGLREEMRRTDREVARRAREERKQETARHA